MLSYPYGIESPMRSGTPNFPPGFGPQVPHHNPNPTPPPGFSRSMTPVSIATANAASFANQAIKPPAPPMPLPIGAGAYTAAKEQSAEAAEAAQAAQAEEQEAVAPIQPPNTQSKKAARAAESAAKKTDKAEKTDKTDKAEKAEQIEKVDKADKVDKTEKVESVITTPVTSAAAIFAAAVSTPDPVPAVLAGPSVFSTPKESSAMLATPMSKVGTNPGATLQDEDFPALGAALFTPSKPARQSAPSKPSTPVGKKAGEKRPVPAVLNIATGAIKKPTPTEVASPKPFDKEKILAGDMSSAFPSLPTPTGATPQAPWSPVVRTAPKTLRVVQTPAAPSGPAPVLSLAAITAAENAKFAAANGAGASPATVASRQASASFINRPSTPASEIVSLSDNASVVSASISASRAGSPPPLSRIGSAAVRSTTKSQQRKQRKQASKKDSAAIAEAVMSGALTSTTLAEQNEDEVVPDDGIAPILGRKKKQKKEKPAPTPAAAAAASKSAASAKDEKREAAAAEGKESKVADVKETKADTKTVKEVETKESKVTKEVKELKEAKEVKEVKQFKETKEVKEVKEVKETKTTKETKSAAARRKEEAKERALDAAVAKAAEKVKKNAAAANPSTSALVQASFEYSPMTDREIEEEAFQRVMCEVIMLADETLLDMPEERNTNSNANGNANGNTNGHANGGSTSPASNSNSSAYTSYIDDDIHVLPGGRVQDVARDLVERGLIDKNLHNLPLLRPHLHLTSNDGKVDPTKGPVGAAMSRGDLLLPPDIVISNEDRDRLESGQIVRKVLDGMRIMITPNGDCVRNLSESEENRFLQLQKSVSADLRLASAFLFDRYNTSPDGYTLINKRAVPDGLPPYYTSTALAALYPSVPPEQLQIVDPIAKIQRHEFIYWSNQFVLPRLSILQGSDKYTWQSVLAESTTPNMVGMATIAPWMYQGGESLPSSDGGLGGRYGYGYAYNCGNDDASSDGDNSTVDEMHFDQENDNEHDNDNDSQDEEDEVAGLQRTLSELDEEDLKRELSNRIRWMTVEEAAFAYKKARRENETYEKAMALLMRKNRRIIMGEAIAAAYEAAESAEAAEIHNASVAGRNASGAGTAGRSGRAATAAY